MGKHIIAGTQVAHVLDAVHQMFYELVNVPTVDRQGTLNDAEFDEDGLKVANELLSVLERRYGLRMGRAGSAISCGFGTDVMFKNYVQMKHWQKMLNSVYSSKEEKPKQLTSLINTRPV